MTTDWGFPLMGYTGPIPENPHLGAFGARRKHHCHEGVDLYAPVGAEVLAVEEGLVRAILPFTGPGAGSPWWHDTQCVLVEGSSGVVNYGELAPASGLVVGSELSRGALIGRVVQVLVKDKGLPMSMLHLELYLAGVTEPLEWLPDDLQPPTLCDPTLFLKQALTMADPKLWLPRGYQPNPSVPIIPLPELKPSRTAVVKPNFFGTVPVNTRVFTIPKSPVKGNT